MRNFDFRMERLLRFRKHLEENQRIIATEQERKVTELVHHKQDLEQESWHQRQGLIKPRGEIFQGKVQHEGYRYLIRVNNEIVNKNQEIFQQTEVLQKQRQLLLERSRDRKTLERLKERHHEVWQEETKQEEQKILDELATVRDLRHKRTVQSQGEKGGILITAILLIMVMAAGAVCFYTWKSWLGEGKVGIEYLRKPFDIVALKKTRQYLDDFEKKQQVSREKRMAMMVAREEVLAKTDHEAVVEQGSGRTLDLIRQKEEELRKKEDELDARKTLLDKESEELKRSLARLKKIQDRITSDLQELKTIEAKRESEIAQQRDVNLDEQVKAVKGMSPKRSASMLLAVAFPDLSDPSLPPLPVAESIEGPDLVIEVLKKLSPTERSAVMDAMVKTSPAKSAQIFDMMDNVATGNKIP